MESEFVFFRSSSGAANATKDEKENVHIELQMLYFAEDCVRQSEKRRAQDVVRFSREYATKEAFHVMMAQ